MRLDLPLHAEGELRDAVRALRVTLHLRDCPDCRLWLADYRSFSREIAGASSERDFTDRVMAAVRRVKAERTAFPFRRLAAAFLVCAGLGAGAGVAYFSVGRSTSEPGQDIAVSPPAARPATPVAARGPWWIFGPEREAHALSDEDPADTTLFTAPDEEHSSGARALWMLTVVTGKSVPSPAGGGFRLVMVPRDGDPREAIPAWSRGWPVRLTDRDLDPVSRARLESPRRRYRIIVSAPDAPPIFLGPLHLPASPGRAFPEPPEPLEPLPVQLERY